MEEQIDNKNIITDVDDSNDTENGGELSNVETDIPAVRGIETPAVFDSSKEHPHQLDATAHDDSSSVSDQNDGDFTVITNEEKFEAIGMSTEIEYQNVKRNEVSPQDAEEQILSEENVETNYSINKDVGRQKKENAQGNCGLDEKFVNEKGLLEVPTEDVEKIKIPDPSVVEEDPQTSVTLSEEEIEPNESMIEGAWADILGSGQLKKKILKAGKPNSRPLTNEICTINVQGKLNSGEDVDVEENFKFQLGDLEVIQGIDLVVALMDVGETSLVEVGPRFAYGSHGNGKDIPSEATILYTIELVAVEKEKDLELVTIEERLKIGNAKRERGNWWYSRGDYPSSIQCYRRALDYLDTENETETDSPDKLQEVLDDRLKVYNNMAAAQMKIEAYDAALKSVEHVLRCQKDNVKAIYRKAKILTVMGKISDGIVLLERALHLDPSSKIIQQDLLRLQAKQKQDVQKERSLYKKMFQLDNSVPATSQGKPKVKLTVPWTLMIGAVTAVVASYVTYRFKLL